MKIKHTRDLHLSNHIAIKPILQQHRVLPLIGDSWQSCFTTTDLSRTVQLKGAQQARNEAVNSDQVCFQRKSYNVLLQQLALSTMDRQRINTKLIMMYCIKKNLCICKLSTSSQSGFYFSLEMFTPTMVSTAHQPFRVTTVLVYIRNVQGSHSERVGEFFS